MGTTRGHQKLSAILDEVAQKQLLSGTSGQYNLEHAGHWIRNVASLPCVLEHRFYLTGEDFYSLCHGLDVSLIGQIIPYTLSMPDNDQRNW
jgi:hypothetical protein